jgi:hypothetical protein
MKKFKFYSIFLIVAVSFSLTFCSSTSSPGDTVVKVYDLIKANQAEKVAAMYVTGKGEKLSEAETKKMEGLVPMAIEQWNKKDGLKNIEVTEEIIEDDGNSAKVNFIINYKNGDSENEKAILVKIDGKWFLKI